VDSRPRRELQSAALRFLRFAPEHAALAQEIAHAAAERAAIRHRNTDYEGALNGVAPGEWDDEFLHRHVKAAAHDAVDEFLDRHRSPSQG